MVLLHFEITASFNFKKCNVQGIVPPSFNDSWPFGNMEPVIDKPAASIGNQPGFMLDTMARCSD
jgi:hypothetical protein